MKKLTKEQLKKKTALFEELEKARDQFNVMLEEANEFRQEMNDLMQEYFDEKSEKWQEGDAGSTYQDWMGEWESELEFDEEAPETFQGLPDECPA